MGCHFLLQLVIGEMQIKTTSYCFTAVRMAVIKKTENDRVDKSVGKLEASSMAGGDVNGTVTLENSLAISQKVRYSDAV